MPKGSGEYLMAITPAEDKRKIRSIILNDEYILSLGFSSDKTYNTNTTDDLLESGNKQIFIYNTQSTDNRSNEKTMEIIIEIDISVPINQCSKADLCAEQIIALLQDYDLGNGSLLQIVSPSPCSLACQSGFYCVGIRVSHYVSKYNKVKTL